MSMTDKWELDQDCSELIILKKSLNLFRVKYSLFLIGPAYIFKT